MSSRLETMPGIDHHWAPGASPTWVDRLAEWASALPPELGLALIGLLIIGMGASLVLAFLTDTREDDGTAEARREAVREHRRAQRRRAELGGDITTRVWYR